MAVAGAVDGGRLIFTIAALAVIAATSVDAQVTPAPDYTPPAVRRLCLHAPERTPVQWTCTRAEVVKLANALLNRIKVF
jgi:hypothetical protein